MKATEISNLKIGDKVSDVMNEAVYNNLEVIEIHGLGGVLLKNIETGSESFQSLAVLLSDETRAIVDSRL